MHDAVWSSESQTTIASLYEERLHSDPSSEYLDVCGTKLTAADVVTDGWCVSTVLDEIGLAPQDRVATILENSPAAVTAWAGIVLGGHIAVPVNTAYKGYYLRHQLEDCGARVSSWSLPVSLTVWRTSPVPISPAGPCDCGRGRR
jgi:crotonobetaine/carnitine-CoA ligase